MPKIRLDGYEFYFFSNEGTEPPHVHVMIDGVRLKFWLNDGSLVTRAGVSNCALVNTKSIG